MGKLCKRKSVMKLIGFIKIKTPLLWRGGVNCYEKEKRNFFIFKYSYLKSNKSLTLIFNAFASTNKVDIVVFISPLSILPICDIDISQSFAKSSCERLQLLRSFFRFKPKALINSIFLTFIT
jgi:hypothetical protein